MRAPIDFLYTHSEMFESIPLILLTLAIGAGILFGTAGRLDLPMVWAYLRLRSF